ncbi:MULTISPECIES: FxDxF family PEP-CTERM protein [Aquincola]|uniref:FxDxF family PEP-CTERM protein n=1 Tax=Aquincola TaxID=391952 RepID=UPI0009F9D178|nr:MULTISPECIES: FxDxF family PEP-CTERM protein [Aquincola]MCR5866336.1 FxDxF family PEP-CTERM protein [Aquincola sp. J276]
MKQVLKQSAVLAAVVLACAQANAASTTVFTTFGDSITSGADHAFAVVAGSFVDTFSFTLTGESTIEAGLTAVLPSSFSAGFFELSSFTSPGSIASGSIGSTFTANLAAGDYFYTVKGVGTPGSTYALKSVVAAVPEPETYALFLAGLGAIGFMAARRRSN